MSKDKSFELLLLKAIKGVLMQNVEDANLFIAGSGVGKSTLINYLLGCVMKYIKLDGDDRVVVDHCFGRTNLAGIGGKVEACTLFPSVYSMTDKDGKKTFIDFAGTGGNREKDIVMLEMLVTQIAIKAINSVKSIIVPISYNELLAPKLKPILDIIRPISQMFKDPMKHRDAIRLVVTHVPKGKRVTKTWAIKKLENLNEHINGILRNEDTIENKNMVMILDYIINNKDNITIFNPLSTDTRKELFSNINGAKSFSSSEINLVASDDIKIKFIERIDEIIHDGNNLFDKLISLPKAIQEETDNKDYLDELVFKLENRIRDLKSDNPEKISIEERIKDLKASIEQREAQINTNSDKIVSLDKEVAALRNDIEEINCKTELVVFDTIVWSEHDTFDGKGTQGHAVEKLIQWSGPPFSTVRMRNGVARCNQGGSPGGFVSGSEKIDAEKGYYEIKYLGPPNCFGGVTMDIMMELRNYPTQRSELTRLRSKLEANLNERKKLSDLNEILWVENEKVKTTLDKTSADLLINDVELKKLILQAEQVELENRSAELARSIAYLDKLIKSNESNLLEFKDNRVTYQVLMEYNSRIGFESDKFKKFTEMHTEVLAKLDLPPVKLEDIKVEDDPIHANRTEKNKANFIESCEQCNSEDAERYIQTNPILVDEMVKDQNFALDLALECDEVNKLNDFVKMLLLKGATKCSKSSAEDIINNHAKNIYKQFPENSVMLRQAISIIASIHNIVINEESAEDNDETDCVNDICDNSEKRGNSNQPPKKYAYANGPDLNDGKTMEGYILVYDQDRGGMAAMRHTLGYKFFAALGKTIQFIDPRNLAGYLSMPFNGESHQDPLTFNVEGSTETFNSNSVQHSRESTDVIYLRESSDSDSSTFSWFSDFSSNTYQKIFDANPFGQWFTTSNQTNSDSQYTNSYSTKFASFFNMFNIPGWKGVPPRTFNDVGTSRPTFDGNLQLARLVIGLWQNYTNAKHEQPVEEVYLSKKAFQVRKRALLDRWDKITAYLDSLRPYMDENRRDMLSVMRELRRDFHRDLLKNTRASRKESIMIAFEDDTEQLESLIPMSAATFAKSFGPQFEECQRHLVEFVRSLPDKAYPNLTTKTIISAFDSLNKLCDTGVTESEAEGVLKMHQAIVGWVQHRHPARWKQYDANTPDYTEHAEIFEAKLSQNESKQNRSSFWNAPPQMVSCDNNMRPVPESIEPGVAAYTSTEPRIL